MLVRIIWQPKVRQLRQFGGCAVAALPLLAWLCVSRTPTSEWGLVQKSILVVSAAAALASGLLALVRPTALKGAFVVAQLVTLPIGFVVGEFVLLAAYFLLFAPVALCFRLLGRDALHRRFDAGAASYWSPRIQPADPASYFHQS